MATYFTLLTNIGLAKLANAQALGQVVQWSNMAVGDGNGNPTTPTQGQTALVRERYRANINQLTTDASNPNYLIAELIVPTTVGGWSVYEVGIFDADGDMVAVANFPATYKPQLSEGSGRDLVIRIVVQVSNTSTVQLKVDPAVILASQKWVVDNFSKAKLLPGGTTNQMLAKNSNADGDFKWVDPTAAVQVIVATEEETQTLADGQTIIDLATLTTQGIAVYIEGARLRADAFTINSTTRITLGQARPAGTKVTLVQNEQTGTNLFARKDGETFTGPVLLAGNATANLGAVPKQQMDSAAQSVSSSGYFRNLKLSATGVDANVTVSFDVLQLADGAGSFATDTNVAGTINTAATGAGGLDTGALASSTWYSVWRIGKPDGTRSWLISASATAPTLPAGYTLKARIGWIRTDWTANKYPLRFVQFGRRVAYSPNAGTNLTGYPSVASSSGSIATTSVSIASAVPPTASSVGVVVSGNSGSGQGEIGFGGNYAAYARGVPLAAAITYASGADIQLDQAGGPIYWGIGTGSGFSATMYVTNWEDNL